jgi:hypothetical protein
MNFIQSRLGDKNLSVIEQRTDLTLGDRIFVCLNPAYGYVGDRDESASSNIVQEALRLVGQS